MSNLTRSKKRPPEKRSSGVTAVPAPKDDCKQVIARHTSNRDVLRSQAEKRAEKIAARREQIPKAYRGIYDKAVAGKSLRAAVNAQCLECVCWQRKEVTLCTDLACPLYAARPYQGISQNGHGGGFLRAESKNSDEADSGTGGP